MADTKVLKAKDYGVGADKTPRQNSNGIRFAYIAAQYIQGGAYVELPPGEIHIDCDPFELLKSIAAFSNEQSHLVGFDGPSAFQTTLIFKSKKDK